LHRRLTAYRDQTAPLIDYYRSHGLLRSVDGMKPVENVAAQIEWALLEKPGKAAPEKPAAARLVREKPVSAKGAKRGPVKLEAAAPGKPKPALGKPPSRSVGKKSASARKSSGAKAARKARKASLLGARRKVKARVKAAKRRR